MRYATNYDIGERKRPTGINEDSVALSAFEQGHRAGVLSRTRTVEAGTDDPGDGSDTVELPANRSAAAFVLADGAGGHEAGDVASYIATTVICEELAPVAIRAARADPAAFGVDLDRTPHRPTPAELRRGVEDAIVTAHRAILANANESGTGAYTTVVAGVVVDGQVHYGWVGDSRAYVVNSTRETIERLTKDHAVVEDLHEEGRIDDVEAHVHPRGNEITRALGGKPDEDPETATVAVDTDTVDLYAEDTLLVTSDGLVDAQTDAPDLYEEYVESDRSDEVAETVRERAVTDDEIRDAVLDGASLVDAAATLGEVTNDRGGKDNFSVLLLADGSFPETPGDPPPRDVDAERPLEDRQTRIIPGE